MRCEHCNEKLAVHDLWCIKCGRRTEVLNKELSAIKSLTFSWSKYKTVKGKNFPTGIWASVIGAIPLIALIAVFKFVAFPLSIGLLHLVRNVLFLLYVPVMLVPFHAICSKEGYLISSHEYFHSFSYYMSYFLFSFISIIFYLTIFLICRGDPILRLVWLTLVLYWISIIIPVPVLMERFKINAWKSIKLSYKKAGDVRWNIFLLGCILMVVNIMAAAFLLIGLAVSIPFTWFTIRDYADKLIEFEIFNDMDTDET